VIGLHKEIAMQQVEITVRVNGHLVQQQVEQIEGTLEDMEEKIDAMTRRLASAALQASVDAVPPPRPLFLHREENCDTRATRAER